MNTNEQIHNGPGAPLNLLSPAEPQIRADTDVRGIAQESESKNKQHGVERAPVARYVYDRLSAMRLNAFLVRPKRLIRLQIRKKHNSQAD